MALESLSRSYGRGGARREAAGGEGLDESAVQTLTSQASLGPLLSREGRERVKSVSPAPIGYGGASGGQSMADHSAARLVADEDEARRIFDLQHRASRQGPAADLRLRRD